MNIFPKYRIGTKLLKGEVAYEITGIVKKDSVIEAYILKDKDGNRCRVSAENIRAYTKVK